MATIIQSGNKTMLKSKHYNFIFDKLTGFFARWGATKEEDPQYSPFGPEIADIEISTICSGVGKVCDFCYKKNTPNGTNMSLATFKELASKLPPTVTQIAFGIGDIDSHPEMWDIFNYAREIGIIPNVTVNGAGITDEIAAKLEGVCGAVAVSLYDKDVTYDAVEKLTKAGLEQTNIHFMIANETYGRARELMNDRLTDPRLANMRAIVFLSLKKKGRAETGYNPLTQGQFNLLANIALKKKVAFGFDSCGAQKFSVRIHYGAGIVIYAVHSIFINRNNYSQRVFFCPL